MMMHSPRCFVLITLACLAGAAEAIDFSLFADIHFDPAYGSATGLSCKSPSSPELGRKGCESPIGLVQSIVEDISAQKVSYNVYLGDWQRHASEKSGKDTQQLYGPVAKLGEIKTNGQLPKPDYLGSIGNNDVVPDYHFPWNTKGEPTWKSVVELLENSELLLHSEAPLVSECGFYARSVSDTLRMIVLNTILWSSKLTPPVPSNVDDPCGQLKFLKSELSKARTDGVKVIITGHIPPVADAFIIVKRGSFADEASDMYWSARFQAQYFSLLAENKDIVRIQLFGHAHLFSLQASPSVGVSLAVVSAVSPLFGNTPAYMIGSFAENWELLELRQRCFLEDGTWTDGTKVAESLGVTSGLSDVDSLHESLTQLLYNDELWSNYLTLHSGGEKTSELFSNISCGVFCRSLSVCSMTTASYSELTACVASAEKAASMDGIPTNLQGSIVTLVLIIFDVLLVVVIISLVFVVPKIRSGELSLRSIHFDFRAQLLNQPTASEREAERVAALKRREEVLAAACVRIANEQPSSFASANEVSAEQHVGDAHQSDTVSFVAVDDTMNRPAPQRE